MNSKIALLVLSCDKYSELWVPLLQSFQEKWPDCTFEKYLVSNYKEIVSSEFKILNIGDDISWSSNLLKALNILKNDYQYVFITLDDLFLNEKVNTEYLLKIFNSFFENNGNYLQLIKSPLGILKYNKYFGEIKPESIYRTTCVFALWKISTLEDILIPSENAWEFEKKGAVRSNSYNNFFATYKDFFQYRNTVVRGKIVRKDAKSFNLTQSKLLKVMTVNENISFKLRYFFFLTITKILPWKYQKKTLHIKNLIFRKTK